MVGAMALISVGPNDQVWSLDANDRYMVYFRKGVTPSELSGKTWKALEISKGGPASMDSSVSSSMSDIYSQSNMLSSQMDRLQVASDSLPDIEPQASIPNLASDLSTGDHSAQKGGKVSEKFEDNQDSKEASSASEAEDSQKSKSKKEAEEDNTERKASQESYNPDISDTVVDFAGDCVSQKEVNETVRTKEETPIGKPENTSATIEGSSESNTNVICGSQDSGISKGNTASSTESVDARTSDGKRNPVLEKLQQEDGSQSESSGSRRGSVTSFSGMDMYADLYQPDPAWTSWIKKGSLQYWSDTKPHRWVDCRLHLEQSSGKGLHDCKFTCYYKYYDSEKYLQFPLSEIVCVLRVNHGRNQRPVLAIYTAKRTAKKVPVRLACSTEKELEDWVSDWTIDYEPLGGADEKGWMRLVFELYHGYKGWNDYVRRRRWMRKAKIVTTGPWLEAPPQHLKDISVQVDQPESSTDPIALWAISVNGDVLCRMGVIQDFPQVSVGQSSVWAVDKLHWLWFRTQVTPTFPEGTRWDYLSPNVKKVSVGPQDQVWVLQGYVPPGSRGVVGHRLGVKIPEVPIGKTWDTQGIGGGWIHLSVRACTVQDPPTGVFTDDAAATIKGVHEEEDANSLYSSQPVC
uniref:Tectonin beta-propeller repeat-containing protein 1 n=1 Tax=Branchiostoma floridae TaxID=7739 RepID=C3YC63_BRAFL|eukprot:XP_002606085.1 hypothetical protein BRAFLDRAFT_87995 [Branchiostoma floridae]